MVPFFVLGTPRSRTAWLAKFLSVPGHRTCLHEPSQSLRTARDLGAMVRHPGAAISDSMLTYRWRDILDACPAARIVVVRRDLGEVAASFERIDLWHPSLSLALHRLQASIQALIEAAPVLVVPFHAMESRDVCGSIYRHCHGFDMPAGHFEGWSTVNVQANHIETLARARANIDGMRAMFPEVMELA